MATAKLEKCEICARAVISNRAYCLMHEAARRRVTDSYHDWERAYPQISWERYLERIIELKETGEASREVARHLLVTVE